MKALVLLSAAGGGDRQPVIALAVGLAEHGHDVTFLCDPHTSGLVEGTGIPTITHDVEQAGYISRWIKLVAEVDHPPNPLIEWGTLAIETVGGLASGMAPDVIVSSLFCMGLADRLASQMDVPWCFVNPSFYFGEGSRSTWEDDWFGPFVPRLAEDCFAPLVQRADLVLHAVDPVFDLPPRRLPAAHHYVGYLLWEPQAETPSFLAEPGDPWALVSASTARPGDELTMLRAAVGGLANHPVRAILTAPKGSLPEDLSSWASVVGHVPHSLILRKSAISVNQASAGIVSKCLTYGVPMVLLPWDADQPGVAARAAALGVAATIARDSVTSGTVSDAVAEVIREPSYATIAADVAAILRTRNPIKTAVELVEQL